MRKPLPCDEQKNYVKNPEIMICLETIASYRNQSTDMPHKPIEWFLYDMCFYREVFPNRP